MGILRSAIDASGKVKHSISWVAKQFSLEITTTSVHTQWVVLNFNHYEFCFSPFILVLVSGTVLLLNSFKTNLISEIRTILRHFT